MTSKILIGIQFALLMLIAFFMTSGFALAQVAGANSDSRSGAVAETESTAVSGSAVVQNYYNSGETSIRSAPPVSAPSVFGGGHPCLAGQSGGISVMGGGASYGQSNAEPACMAWLMGNPEVAIAIMMENEKFRRAVCRVGYYRLGETKYPIQCGSTKPAKRAASTGSSKPALTVRCDRKDGKIIPVVSRKVADAYTTAQIQGACKG